MSKATINQLGKLWAEHKRLQQDQKKANFIEAPKLREKGSENWKKLTEALDSLLEN